jgi:predicted O-methyltransferase YrrM
VISRVAAVARDVLHYRSRYPVVRAAPATRRAPVDALADLGFDREALGAYREEYRAALPGLVDELGRVAREHDGDTGLEHKFESGMLLEHEPTELVYLAVRARQPELVFETGTWAGIVSSAILLALEHNGRGALTSFDLPAYEPIEHATDVPLPPGAEPGWIVPAELRTRLSLVTGDTRQTLPQVLASSRDLGVFVHDSLHTTRHMLFEYRTAWPRLEPGGLLLSDDIFMTPAFWLFAHAKRLQFRHSSGFGVLRKPDPRLP